MGKEGGEGTATGRAETRSCTQDSPTWPELGCVAVLTAEQGLGNAALN